MKNMANFVIMPRQGQSVESCIITTWHKKVGDAVSEGEVLFSYETDKSAFDEKSLFAGTVLHLFAEEGDVVPCLEPVCIIGNAGEDISDMLGKGDTDASAPAEEKAEEKAPTVSLEGVKVTVEAGERIKISPRAKNLALKTGVDMTAVTASGPHGRIIERDINAALDRGAVATVASVEDFLAGKLPETASSPVEEVAAPAEAPTAEYTEQPMSGIRRAIARNMQASLTEMAQLTLNTSFDATDIMNFRAKLKEKGEALGLGKITLNDIVFYAVSRVLPKYPELNATLTDNTLRIYKHANIGLAVDTEKGLYVPTIFAADTLSLAELSEANKAAAAKAREGTLTPAEMSSGSFTVTNLGSMGIESFTPVINPPQVGILGVCAIINRLRADGSVYPAMGLSLTFDHRALDGSPAARFLKELVASLENFSLLLAK